MLDRAELVLVAHGTRRPEGVETIGELAAAVAARVASPRTRGAKRPLRTRGAKRPLRTRGAKRPIVRTAFVDVLGPNPAEVLADIDGPAIVVPAFLASGYHVHTDLPARIAQSGHRSAAVTPALGPDPVLADVMHSRLIEAGWRPGDVVVMAAAGSSDPHARRELFCAAKLLARRAGEVHLGFVATGAPAVPDVVGALRTAGHKRVFIASYLLAPGLFHTRLSECGATAVTEPLGAHPAVVELLASRFAAVPVAA